MFRNMIFDVKYRPLKIPSYMYVAGVYTSDG